MPILGWVVFSILAVVIGVSGILLFLMAEQDGYKVLTIVITVAICIGLLIGMRWYYHNTASGRRKMIDEKSNLNNGIERTINVYTADGAIMATYTGKIDIQESEGGYVKFDYQEKRYIYYNCFVETIAEIE